ncbi:MAG: methionyl-tRNA formyltransferase [Bacteroidetes bacterium]|nr:methionyl-tRNA formyltransferase [Bacteroidota bacterium]
MRIVFMGTPDFAVPSLRTLHEAGHDIAYVVTAPDKKRGRGQQLSPTPVKAAAEEMGLTVMTVDALRDPAFAAALRACDAELFVIVAFRILPEEVFTIPSIGSFNLHASLLPRYRGAAPLNWVLINGDAESGVTTFFLRKKVDTGNMLLQERVPVDENMTAGELHDVLADIGARTVLRTVEMIAEGKAVPRPQDDTLATPAPKIFRETCAIPWEKAAREVHNHIRGLSPHPAAWTMLHDAEMKILESRVAEESSSGSPGTLISTVPELHVQCGSGSVLIRQLKPEGRKQMSAEEYLRGHRLEVGERFDSAPVH